MRHRDEAREWIETYMPTRKPRRRWWQVVAAVFRRRK